MRGMGLLTGIGVMVGLATGAAADPTAICRRGAVAEPPSLVQTFNLEAQGYAEEALRRMDMAALEPPEDAGEYDWYRAAILAPSIEWPGVLADRAADLPKAAHDLPWLILLAEQEMTHGNPVWPLVVDPQSILLPDLIPLMRRHGMTAEADVLARAMALFPVWDINPAERQLVLYGWGDGEIDLALSEALDAISEDYPAPGGATAAVLDLLDSQPEVAQVYHARMAALGPEARLDLLLIALRQTCLTEWHDAADDVSGAYLALGSAQAALLMMEDLAVSLEDGSAEMWLSGTESNVAPHLLTVLDLRGEAALADGVRRAMAELPLPFPRDAEARWSALEALPDAAWERIDTAMPGDAHDRLRAAMLLLARDSGLLAVR